MKKIILWGQPLINRVVKKGAPIVATHNVTEPPPPIHIVSIDRIVTGTCEYPQSGTCVATSQYEVMGTEFTAPVTLVWSVSAGATITAGQGTKIITVTTDSNTNTTYDVTCVATDISGSDTKTETFTDVRTQEIPKVYRYCAANGGCHSRSDDNGVTWTKTSDSINNIQAPLTLAVNGTTIITTENGGYANRSTDNGATWTLLPRGLGNSGATYHAMANNGNTWVAVGTNGYASRSTDNGATWTPLPQGLGNSNTTYEINGIAANGNTWVAVGTNGYASRSIDDGATWTPLPRGLGGTTTANLRTVECNGNVWVAVDNNSALFTRSTDDGATWAPIAISGISPNYGSPGEWEMSALGNTWLWTTYGGYLARSTDNGATWTQIPTNTANDIYSVNGKDGIWMAVGLSNTSIISTNDGITWTNAPYQLNSSQQPFRVV